MIGIGTGALMKGDSYSDKWFYAVGAKEWASTQIPGPIRTNGVTTRVPTTELYIKIPDQFGCQCNSV